MEAVLTEAIAVPGCLVVVYGATAALFRQQVKDGVSDPKTLDDVRKMKALFVVLGVLNTVGALVVAWVR